MRSIFPQGLVARLTQNSIGWLLVAFGVAWCLSASPAFAQTETIFFGQSSYTATNGGGDAVISVVFDGVIGQVATVDYSTSAGNAVSGVDYVDVSGTLNFNLSITNTFTVTILNDPTSFSNTTVNLTLANATGDLSLGTPSTAVLTIVSTNVPTPILSFAQSTFSADDTDTVATITLIRTGVLTGAVTVDVATGDGSAHAGTDYVASTGTVDFADGQLTNTFTIPLLPPGLLETNLTINLNLQNPTGGATIGAPSQAVLTLVPTGPPVIQLSASAYNFHEKAGSATITAIRFNNPSNAVSVAYATSDGSAVSGVDYLPTSGTLVFNPGVSVASFSFQFIQYKTFQSNKTVNVTLSNPVGASLGTQDTAVVTIVNNQPQTITFTNASTDVVTLSLKYAGTMQVTSTDPLDLILSGTDATSVFTIGVKKGRHGTGLMDIDMITGDGGAKLFKAPNSDLVGPGLQMGGYVGGLLLHDVLDGATVMTGGGAKQRMLFTAHNIDDGATVSLGSRVSSFTAARFGAGTLNAPSIGALTIRGDRRVQLPGDFEAQAILSGASVYSNQVTLGNMVVAGSISNAAIGIGTGREGSISAGTMVDSIVFVGYTPTDDTQPLAGGTFTPGATLGGIKVGGKANGFANSFLIATSIGQVNLSSVNINNGGVPFGFLVNQNIQGVRVLAPRFVWRRYQANDQSSGDFHVIK
jgi:hypothetical protein